MLNRILSQDQLFQLKTNLAEYSLAKVVTSYLCKMFAIAFDMDIKELRNTYGEPYNNAYYEIKIILRKYGFYNTQGSVYLTE